MIKFLKIFLPVDRLAALVNILILVGSVALLLTHPHLPTKIPLWFSRNWGQARLENSLLLWLLPILMGIFFLVSQVFAKSFVKKHNTLAEILVWSTSFISLVFLLALYKIILLVS